mgnify:CR=1 FL=1
MPILKSANKLLGGVVGLFEGVLVATGAMDQIAGAIGAGVVKPGIVSEMTGTTMAVFVPTDKAPEYVEGSKIPCHMNYDGNFALLIFSATAGMALKWFKNNLCEDFSFDDLNKLTGFKFINSYICTSSSYLM